MKVITLNTNSFRGVCDELISKIDFKPDMVVGILNGGGYVMESVKDKTAFRSAQFESIKLQRVEKIKNKSSSLFLLRHLPYLVLNKLREFESQKANRSMASLDMNQLEASKIDFNINTNIQKPIQKILIIDDAIDTGTMMYIARNNLRKLFPEAEIKSAVISWTIAKSIVQPDYYIFKEILVRYPWSKDYKGSDKL